jgi:hypothetical protein
MKVGCGWSPVHTCLLDAGLVAICRVIIKARIFPVLSAKFNAIHIEEQAGRLKFTHRVSSMILFTNETQGHLLASGLFDFTAQ